ncbi:hypothetical protein BJ912DRAFT_1067185 [Pholiota molesta]|nr:hypothetical protein BJ912DRAFT_1067185 [Pholiota molesta]
MFFAFFVAFLSLRDILVKSTPLPFESNAANLAVSGGSNTQPVACPTDDNQRSVQDIVWGCLATIFACSWLAVHPNIPSANAKWWRTGLIRLELMLWTILSPEFVIYWAIRQWIGARQIQKRYKDRGWTKTHGYFIQMGGFMLFDGTVKKGVLSFAHFESLLHQEEIPFPEVTEEEIQDRSKGDWLSKGLVVGQTAWFIAQFVARLVQGLTVTELELVTLAFAALNGFMYFFWWNKPLDVRSPIAIKYLYPTQIDRSSFADVEEKPFPSRSKTTIASRLKTAAVERYQLFNSKPDNLLLGKKRVPIFFALTISSKDDRLITMAVSVIGMIFGAIHCIGWIFSFTSTIEGLLWRISSLIVLGGPAMILLSFFWVYLIFDFFDFNHNPYITMIFNSAAAQIAVVLLCSICIFTYILARFFLIAEAIAGLRNLPLSTRAAVNWTSFLPHV